MKSFAEWVGSMAGTIEDGAEFIRPCSCNTPTQPTSKPTELQRRMDMANLLVPTTNTEDLINDWVMAFCTVMSGVDGGKHFITLSLKDVVGPEEHKEYYRTEGTRDTVVWFVKLKARIGGGWMG